MTSQRVGPVRWSTTTCGTGGGSGGDCGMVWEEEGGTGLWAGAHCTTQRTGRGSCRQMRRTTTCRPCHLQLLLLPADCHAPQFDVQLCRNRSGVQKA